MDLVYQVEPRTVAEAGVLPYPNKAWMHSAGGKQEQTLSKQYWACPALQDPKNMGFSGQMLLNFISSEFHLYLPSGNHKFLKH